MASKKLPPVTYENLKDIFTSRNFAGGLRRSTRIGLQRDTESQFTIWREAFSDETKYFFPNRTTYDNPYSCDFELEPGQYSQIAAKKLIPLVCYHCHADSDPCPSEQDLAAHFDMRGEYNHIARNNLLQKVENYHLDCIGAIRNGGRYHDVLIYQNRSSQTNPREGRFVHQQIVDKLGRRVDDARLLVETMSSLPGWNAHLLTYNKEGSSYRLSHDQLSGLEKFVYTPVLKSDTR